MLLLESYKFDIELDAGRARLIVSKDGKEVVCRKEYVTKLLKFLKTDDGTLFKGRLRLIKTPENIFIRAEGKTIGEISAEELAKRMLN